MMTEVRLRMWSGFRNGSEALLTAFRFWISQPCLPRLALRPQHNRSRGQSTTHSQSSPMNSPVVSPVPRPAEFQAHMYNSFLQGRTSDVALRIRGSWDAIYKSHRVVLIQAVRTLSFLSL